MKKTFLILIVILILGMFLRVYQFQERFIYAHDADLASWIVKDIVIDHHLRLVGQLTSSPGIFIGPLYYYLLIPFYLATNMDPLGSVAFPWIISFLALVSIFYTFRKLYGDRPALIATLVSAASFLQVTTDRDVYPTTPVMLWTIWMFYAANLLFNKNKRGLILSAILLALVWNLNLALILISPILLVAVVKNWRHYSLRDFILPVIIFIILSSPLFIFESRHNFIQFRALFGTLHSAEVAKPNYWYKLNHVLLYAEENANRIYYFYLANYLPNFVLPTLVLVLTLILILRKKLPQYYLFLYPAWIGLFVAFFTFHPINLSEYYLNGINILWYAAGAILLSKLPKFLCVFILGVLVVANAILLINQPINHVGYNEKKAVVNYIKTDAALHGYPCVSVSYMTDIGYNFGYRYWFWLAKLHVNQPKSNSPVYTIVFPHPRANRLDKTFGALGIVNPDYPRYNPKAVSESCSGLDANVTDPMFGFTK